jgi:hypothetical protein
MGSAPAQSTYSMNVPGGEIMNGQTSGILIAAMAFFLISGAAMADEMKENRMMTDKPSMQKQDEKMMEQEKMMKQNDPVKEKKKSMDMERTMEKKEEEKEMK